MDLHDRCHALPAAVAAQFGEPCQRLYRNMLSTVVAATFPQAMNPATINPATFTLTGPGVTPLQNYHFHDVPNQMFVFTPTSTLALNTAFTATITTGAQDVAGNALASNFVWTFTTSAAACVPPPPPTVISVSPPDAALGICPDVAVTATFDEAMNPAPSLRRP